MNKDADDILKSMMAHNNFMALTNADEIAELLEYTHRYLDKRLKVEGNLMIFPYEETMELLLIQGLDISQQLASLIVSTWEEKTLGDYYGVRFSNGDETWKFKHSYHTEDDRPARIRGLQHEWYKYGNKHRDNDLPAVIYDINDEKSRKEWWYNGRLHRTNGQPAIISPQEQRYYIHGQEVNIHIAKLFKS
jgi:hypothetical protein